jgi:hypothetical protein
MHPSGPVVDIYLAASSLEGEGGENRISHKSRERRPAAFKVSAGEIVRNVAL